MPSSCSTRGTQHDLTPLILESLDEGVFTVDADFRITSFNAAAERITQTSRAAAIGRKCYEVFRASICQTGCAMRQTLSTGSPVRDVDVNILDANMRTIPIRVSTAVLKDGAELVGGVEIFRDISDLEALRRQLGRRPLEGIIGRSRPMRDILRLLPDVAASNAAVLLEGASGTGKELVARALHQLSHRKRRRFVQVNCAALPDTLLESELFGHVKGSFTGAQRDRSGRFQLADGGTLFLDEIGDISPAFQAKLLRVLQSGELEPLGSTRTVRVDVRLVAATHRDLTTMIQDGSFREDLYYRIRVIPIRLPLLRERRDDIPLLVDHFLRQLAARTGKPAHQLSQQAMKILAAYHYPGNVRELENGLERALVLSRGSIIDPSDLPPEWVKASSSSEQDPSPKSDVAAGPRPGTDCTGCNLRERLAHDERRLLERELAAHRWNRSATARALGVGRNTLWRKMKAAGLLD